MRFKNVSHSLNDRQGHSRSSVMGHSIEHVQFPILAISYRF